MRTYHFDDLNEDGLILVEATVGDEYEYLLGFDTAATHTTIDSNVLYLSGYDLKSNIGETEIETSNGVIIVKLYCLSFFECLGVRKENFVVQAYDFLAHGITSNYQGLLGLDFLRDIDFCVSISRGIITIQK